MCSPGPSGPHTPGRWGAQDVPWLTCGERRWVLRKKPRRQPTVTESTDRTSSLFRLHTSLPRATMAPSTMVSPACWRRPQHHSMHMRPAEAQGPGWGSGSSGGGSQGCSAPVVSVSAMAMACLAAPAGCHNPITNCITGSREQIRAWKIRAGHMVWGFGPQS